MGVGVVSRCALGVVDLSGMPAQCLLYAVIPLARLKGTDARAVLVLSSDGKSIVIKKQRSEIRN